MKEFILVVVGFILGDAMGIAGIVDLAHKVLKLFSF